MEEDQDAVLGVIRSRILEAEGTVVRQIILHGSRAAGTAGPTSDYDVLVVVDDPVDDWVDRSMALRSMFYPLNIPVDVQVFGHEEFEACRNVPGTLPYPAATRGIILHERRRDSRAHGTRVASCLGLADLRAATRAADARDEPESIGYPAQQSVEKLLKGLLIAHGLEPEPQHELAPLVQRLRLVDRTTADSLGQVGTLTKYAVFYRYPSRVLGRTQALQRQQVQADLAIAQAACDALERAIGARLQAIRPPPRSTGGTDL